MYGSTYEKGRLSNGVSVHAMELLPKQEILEFMDFDSWKEKLTVQIVPVKGTRHV